MSERAPNQRTYVRDGAEIYRQSFGIIRAEAYDRAGRLVKEFQVGRFRKVEGRWQLESMVIRSRATGQETELKFDLQKK